MSWLCKPRDTNIPIMQNNLNNGFCMGQNRTGEPCMRDQVFVISEREDLKKVQLKINFLSLQAMSQIAATLYELPNFKGKSEVRQTLFQFKQLVRFINEVMDTLIACIVYFFH